MIGSLIEDQFKGNAGNWPFGAASSMILLSLVMIVLIYYARAQSKEQIKWKRHLTLNNIMYFTLLLVYAYSYSMPHY